MCGLPHTTQRCFGCLTDALHTQFLDAVELPRWGDLLKHNVAIFDLDFDAILAAMYAATDSAEGDCYLCVPPDPGIGAAALGASESAAPGTSESAAPGTGESAALGAGESALSGTAPSEALHTFTLDSGALRSFFCDLTTLTPLSRPVAVSLADPSGGPVIAHSSTVLPCPVAPLGLLSGLHLPSFSTNLVSGADLQDVWVDQFTPGGQRVTHCTCSRTGHHRATFTRRPGSSLYTLTTASPLVTASGQVAASGQVFATASRSSLASALCSCRMASRTLVSGLPRSLPPLPLGPAPTCVPCVEGRQRAAPHSSEFPPTEAPLQILHMVVWGPARVSGQGHERYFLLVVDDYSRYTTIFPLRRKGEVSEVLIDWIRGARRQLSESFGLDLPVLRLHSDRGGEFSFDLLRAFCRAEGIRQTFTLPASSQKNGIAERHIGMVMDVAHTSMIHVAAPHFLWPFTVQYAVHQINLQPRVSLQETTPTLRWTGKVGDASVFRVLGSRAFLDPVEPVEVAVNSGAARGAEPAGAGPGGAEPGVAESEGAEPGGAEPARVEPGGAEPGGAESGGAEPEGAEPERAESGGPPATGPAAGGASRAGAARGGADAGAARAARPRCAGAGGPGTVGGPTGVGAAGGTGAAGPRGSRTGGTGAAGAGGVAGVGAVGAGAAGGTRAGGAVGVVAGDLGAEVTGAVSAVSRGAARPRPYYVPLLLQQASPLPGPSAYYGPTRGLTERHEPESRPASPESRSASPESRPELPVCTVRTGRRVPLQCPPLVSGTHYMTLRPSTAPQRLPLPSSPLDGPDPESDPLRAASPTVTRFLATVVTDPSFESTAASVKHIFAIRFGFTYSSPQSTPLPTGHSLSAPPSDESVEPSGPYPELVGCLITSGMGLVLGGRARVVLAGHADASWELHWLTNLLTDLGEAPRSPPVLYVDNKAMLALCQEHRLEHRSKHIALRYFLARELQQRGQLRLAYVASQANIADVFTKALQPCDHQRFCTVLGLEWSGRMRSPFKRYKLLKIAVGEEKMPGEGDARDRWIEKSAVLYDLILQSVNNDMFQHIKDLVKTPGKIKFVAAASGALLPVIGVGNAKVMGANGEVVGLGNVLLVEGLSANLLSVHRLQKSKAEVTFGPTSCRAKLGKMLLWNLEEKSSCIKDLWQLPIIPWKGKPPAIAKAAGAAKATAGGEESAPTAAAMDAVKKVQQPQQPHREVLAGVDATAAWAKASSGSGEADWEMWHERLCHVNIPMLQKLVKDGCLKGLEVKGGAKEIGNCPTCLETKFTKFPFSSSTGPAKAPLALVHMDVVGPTRALSLSGSRYFLTIVDDHTRAVWVYPLKTKGEVAAAVLKEWMPRAQRESGHKVKVIRTDNGGEFIGADVEKELKRKGIQHQLTVPYNPEQNGVAERFNRTLQEGARTLIGRAGLPDPFWVTALRQVVVVKNREKRGKLEASGRWGVHLGLAKDHKGWLIWDLTSQQLTVSRDVKFLESLYYKEWKQQQQQKLPMTPLIVEADEVQRPSRQVEVSVSKEEISGVTDDGGEPEVEQQQQQQQEEQGAPQGAGRTADRPRRDVRPPNRLTYASRGKPKVAMLALCQEHRLEHRTKHIALRYFLARELQQRGQLRLAYVASQANTADVFTKALQPSSALVAELVDFAAACRLDYTASLIAEFESASVCPPSVGGECDLGTDVLEDRPEEFECFATALPHLVSMLLAPEGDPDAPDIPTRRSYAEGPYSCCSWDLVFATADTEALAHVKSELQKRHTCTDPGELTSYLGLRITRDRAQRTITLTQSHMVQQVLHRFGFTYSSPQSTPLPTGHSLSAPPSEESVEPSGPYPELVGCLMYLMTCTRPDLAYPLSILARFVAPGRHRPQHWEAAKRVLRYLCSTSGMGLVLGGRGPELCWLTYLLTDLGEPPRSPSVLYVDNKAMIALCQEHILEHRTKHIALRYFLARDLQQRGQIRLAYVATRANTADVFTKVVLTVLLKLRPIDVANAFLYALVDAKIFVEQPHGSNTDPYQVCQLLKSLYGIKQAPRLWRQYLYARLIRIGFQQLPHNQGTYRLTKEAEYIVLIVYVDELLYIGSTDDITVRITRNE
ncbi:unnamed protein product [Closterium sp. NIES-54]